MSDSPLTTPNPEVPDEKPEKPPARRVVRVLSSELDEDLRETLHGFVREAIGNQVWLETLLPENPLDSELLRTAIEHHWDLAMLILDHIKYPSNDRSPAAIIAGAGKLIKGLRQTTKNPLICFYNRTDDPNLSKTVLAAGAEGVFRLPCKSIDVVPTLKRCLETFAAPPPPPLPPPLPKAEQEEAPPAKKKPEKPKPELPDDGVKSQLPKALRDSWRRDLE